MFPPFFGRLRAASLPRLSAPSVVPNASWPANRPAALGATCGAGPAGPRGMLGQAQRHWRYQEYHSGKWRGLSWENPNDVIRCYNKVWIGRSDDVVSRKHSSFHMFFFQDCLLNNQRILKLERYAESPGKDII